MSDKSKLKDKPYPCKNCPVLPICLGRDHYNTIKKCDILVNYLIDKYIGVLEHFGRCCITVDPLNKRFEMKFSYERKGIVIGEPFRDDAFYIQAKRIIVNPYNQKLKGTILPLGEKKDVIQNNM
jgi:hypothetical protein